MFLEFSSMSSTNQLVLRISQKERDALDNFCNINRRTQVSCIRETIDLILKIIEEIRLGKRLIMRRSSENIVLVCRSPFDKSKIALNDVVISGKAKSKGYNTTRYCRLSFRINPNKYNSLMEVLSVLGANKSEIIREYLRLYIFMQREMFNAIFLYE